MAWEPHGVLFTLMSRLSRCSAGQSHGRAQKAINSPLSPPDRGPAPSAVQFRLLPRAEYFSRDRLARLRSSEFDARTDMGLLTSLPPCLSQPEPSSALRLRDVGSRAQLKG